MCCKPVRIAGLFVHELPPFFNQKLQCARFWRVWVEPPELVAMEREDIQQEPGIARIVFRPRRSKTLTVVYEDRRMNGKDHEVLVFSQHEDEGSSRWFEGHSDRSAAKPHRSEIYPRTSN